MGITFNGVHCQTVGLDVIDKRRPIMAESKDVYIDIPGRSGSIHIPDDSRKDIMIEIDFELESKKGKSFDQSCREVGAYFTTETRERLIFDTDPNYYYMAKVEGGIPTIEQISMFGIFTIEFRCEPFAKEVI